MNRFSPAESSLLVQSGRCVLVAEREVLELLRAGDWTLFCCICRHLYAAASSRCEETEIPNWCSGNVSHLLLSSHDGGMTGHTGPSEHLMKKTSKCNAAPSGLVGFCTGLNRKQWSGCAAWRRNLIGITMEAVFVPESESGLRSGRLFSALNAPFRPGSC